jgi:hypothetical protein
LTCAQGTARKVRAKRRRRPRQISGKEHAAVALRHVVAQLADVLCHSLVQLELLLRHARLLFDDL